MIIHTAKETLRKISDSGVGEGLGMICFCGSPLEANAGGVLVNANDLHVEIDVRNSAAAGKVEILGILRQIS